MQVDEQQHKKYGTISGVFRPTFMTIVGVIMFVREGWVVGNAGLLGALLIIGVAYLITTTTALSMSCIVTNLRIGAGGAFSIIRKSLGIEVGGAVGIPLYLAQALAGAMYIFGFREGLAWAAADYIQPFIESGAISTGLFNFILDLVSFAIMFGIAYVSTAAAFSIQWVVLVSIIVGLVSFITIPIFAPEKLVFEPVLWGTFAGSPENEFSGTSFWLVFAVFFPAATGVMAGANLSGDLKEPRRSIPLGTLGAIAVSALIYVGLAFLFAMIASPEELVSNYNVMMDYSLFPIGVLAGLLGATFSSGLACLIGAPRILQALGEHKLFPGSEWLSSRTASGEPRNALILTGVIILGGIMLRDLNLIAPMITMFFLITYMMINLVVVVEQSLGMVSFRPTFPVWRVIPIVGTFACMMAMFVINPLFGVISIAIVFGVYFYLTRRDIEHEEGDMRSGLFVSLAEWAARQTADLPESNERSWKPNLLVPFTDERQLRGEFGLIRDIVSPRGSVTLIGVHKPGQSLGETVPSLGRDFLSQGVSARWTNIETEQTFSAIDTTMQALSGAFFRPNILFWRVPKDDEAIDAKLVQRLIDRAIEQDMGVQIFLDEPVAGVGQQNKINVWVRGQSPDWEVSMDLGNIDLALLTALKLAQNWHAEIRVICAVANQDDLESARAYIANLLGLARMMDVEIEVMPVAFSEALSDAPQADVNLFGLPNPIDIAIMRKMMTERRSACLFVRDSGHENILA